MNRAELQEIAEVRIDEAGGLLALGKFDGAYYLAGYAVEWALKACIAKKTNQYDFPDKQLANLSFTHNLDSLMRLSDLESQRKADATANPAFELTWQIVKDWSEQSRYERHSEAKARKLHAAITDTTNGVLSWIKARW